MTFKEDGKYIQSDEAIKYDDDKAPLELMSASALCRTSQVLLFGTKKYTANNWRKGMQWSRLIGGLLRHVVAWMGGEDNDPESGLSHLDHAACCIMFLQEYDEKKIGTDDRYKYERRD